MIVEHDILANVNGSENDLRHRIGKEVRSWRRIINLMDAAAYIVKALCHFDRKETIFDMLAYHKQSVSALYAIARVLGMLFSTRERHSVAETDQDDEAFGEETVLESGRRTVSELSAEDKKGLDSILQTNADLARSG